VAFCRSTSDERAAQAAFPIANDADRLASHRFHPWTEAVVGDLAPTFRKAVLVVGGRHDQTISRIGASPLLVLVPTVLEQKAQRYSYLSPSGSTNSRRLRTGTARRQRGQ
jgi:hypothetical protein